MRDILS